MDTVITPIWSLYYVYMHWNITLLQYIHIIIRCKLSIFFTDWLEYPVKPVNIVPGMLLLRKVKKCDILAPNHGALQTGNPHVQVSASLCYIQVFQAWPSVTPRAQPSCCQPLPAQLLPPVWPVLPMRLLEEGLSAALAQSHQCLCQQPFNTMPSVPESAGIQPPTIIWAHCKSMGSCRSLKVSLKNKHFYFFPLFLALSNNQNVNKNPFPQELALSSFRQSHGSHLSHHKSRESPLIGMHKPELFSSALELMVISQFLWESQVLRPA